MPGPFSLRYSLSVRIHPFLFMFLIKPIFNFGMLLYDHCSILFTFFTSPGWDQSLNHLPVAPPVSLASLFKLSIFIGNEWFHFVMFMLLLPLLSRSGLFPQIFLNCKVLTLYVHKVLWLCSLSTGIFRPTSHSSFILWSNILLCIPLTLRL